MWPQGLVADVDFRPQRGYDIGLFLGITSAKGDPDDTETFERQRFHVKYTFGTAQATHADQAALDGGAPDVAFQMRTADMVNDDVGSVAIGQSENPVGKTGLAYDHHMVRSH